MTTYSCAVLDCSFSTPSYNALIEHDQAVHGAKPLDPGNEFSSPTAKKLDGIIAWLRRAPDANLRTGEGAILLDEIDRLAGKLLISETTIRDLEQKLAAAHKGQNMT